MPATQADMIGSCTSPIIFLIPGGECAPTIGDVLSELLLARAGNLCDPGFVVPGVYRCVAARAPVEAAVSVQCRVAVYKCTLQ